MVHDRGMDSTIAPGFLVAAPQLRDPNFERTVVFMIEHADDEGSLGLVINRPAEVDLESVLGELEVEAGPDSGGFEHPPILFGGPVSPERGWILHTPDWRGRDTKDVGDGVCVTASVDILEAISSGLGPSRYRFCLGYSGWGPHQLVGEIKTGSWINVPFSADLIFDVPLDDCWDMALERLGIDPQALAHTMGDA